MVRAKPLPPIGGGGPLSASASSPALHSGGGTRARPAFPSPQARKVPLGAGVPKSQQFTLYHDYVQRSGVNKLVADLMQDLVIMQPEEPVSFMIDFLKGRLPPPPPDPERVMMLEELFEACDDDGSGALSLNEFAQLFERVDENTREMFAEVDMDVSDGKLTQKEFVTFHLQKFSALSDDTFKLIVAQLTERAEDVDVIDDEAAVVIEGELVFVEASPTKASTALPAREEFLMAKVAKGHVITSDERLELERAQAGEKVASGKILSGRELGALKSSSMSREMMLEDLFQACDDDGSGALSLNEFSQLFDKVDETTREMFESVDIEVADGKLTQEEFVTFHLQMFSALNDDLFKEVVSQLTSKAEDVDVIDDDAAVVVEKVVSEREMMLEDLFQACDDDGSGALSLNEFAQLFDKVDETTREMFAEVDMDVSDGKLTQEEFVTFHLQKFSALSDQLFKAVVSQLTAKAEDEDVVDDEPAVVA